jgi:hypothetical protein
LVTSAFCWYKILKTIKVHLCIYLHLKAIGHGFFT